MRFSGLLSGAGGWISGDALLRPIIGSWRGGLVGMRFPGLLSGAGGVD